MCNCQHICALVGMKFLTEVWLLCECGFEILAIWPGTSLWQSFLMILIFVSAQCWRITFVVLTATYSFVNTGIILAFRPFLMSWAYKAYFLFYIPIIDDKFLQFYNQLLHGRLLHLLFSSSLFMCGNVTSGDALIVPFLEVIPTGISFLGLTFLSLSKCHFQAVCF